jgi:hypothetical protein
MIKKYFFFYVFLTNLNILFSQPSSNFSEVFDKTVDLILDNETARPGFFGSCFQYCYDTGYLAYFNVVTRSIKYFDLSTGFTVGETKFIKEGPNAVYGDPVYFHYHNSDSIFVFSEFQNSRIFLINSQGIKINTFDFNSDNNYNNVPFPRLSKVSGAIVVSAPYVYLAFNISEQPERNSVAPIIRFNMQSLEFQYLQEPKGYTDLDLKKLPKIGQYHFYESKMSLSKDRESVIVSFPLDNDFYVYKNSGVRTIRTGSKYLNKFTFLSNNKTRYNTKMTEYKKVVFGSARYFGIYYDDKNEVYYRLLKLDNSSKWKRKLESGSDEIILKEYSLMEYDLDFNLRSEKIFGLEGATPESGMFVGPGGLWVLLSGNTNENIMSIGLLKKYE